MRTLWTTVVLLGVVTGGTTSGLAQSADGQERPPLPARAIPLAEHTLLAPQLSAPDSARHQAELEKWIDDFTAWKQWVDRWGNRREPGWFSDFRQRRQRPDPPIWLFEHCRDSIDDTGEMAESCALLAEWRADWATAQASSARVAVSTGRKKTTRRSGGSTSTWTWPGPPSSRASPSMA